MSSDSFEPTPSARPNSRRNAHMTSWHAGLLLAALNGAFGAATGLFLGNPAADLVLQALQIVAVAGVLFAWATFDARSIGKQLSAAQGICVILFGYFAVPFYLAFYRDNPSWPRWIGKGVIISALCIGAFLLAATLASGMAA